MPGQPPIAPIRASMLIDAPETDVRQALSRSDVWSRTVRAFGGRGELSRGTGSSVMIPGDLLRLTGPVRVPGWLGGPRGLLLRVEAGEDGTPVLRSAGATRPSWVFTTDTASTAAGTVATVEMRADGRGLPVSAALRRPMLEFAQMLLGIATLVAREPGVVMAAVIVDGDRVLAARRRDSGLWEFPGGKVEPGETEEAALARELAEELSIEVRVGSAVGPEVPLDGGFQLRARVVELLGDQPRPGLDHDELRWLDPSELADVEWLPADRLLLQPIQQALRVEGRR